MPPTTPRSTSRRGPSSDTFVSTCSDGSYSICKGTDWIDPRVQTVRCDETEACIVGTSGPTCAVGTEDCGVDEARRCADGRLNRCSHQAPRGPDGQPLWRVELNCGDTYTCEQDGLRADCVPKGSDRCTDEGALRCGPTGGERCDPLRGTGASSQRFWRSIPGSACDDREQCVDADGWVTCAVPPVEACEPTQKRCVDGRQQTCFRASGAPMESTVYWRDGGRDCTE